MGSLTMTENMTTTLTCKADLGYPADWSLVWSNNRSDIGDQPATSEALSGASQRYMFTSVLEFTPKKQDNTHFITCTASRALWTSTPLPEETLGPINVQCKYLNLKHTLWFVFLVTIVHREDRCTNTCIKHNDFIVLWKSKSGNKYTAIYLTSFKQGVNNPHLLQKKANK